MPLPAAYTESALIGFMETEVAAVLADLGLDTSDALLEAAYETEALLGHAVAAETDILKLRTIARWQAWLAAYNAATAETDLKAGSVDLKSSQVFAHLEKRLAQAEASAMRYDEVAAAVSGANAAYVTGIGTGSNPYAYSTADEWS